MQNKLLNNSSRVGILILFLVGSAWGQCPFLWSLTPTSTKMYLYFAGAADSTFPEYNVNAQTSPLERFDVADLDSSIGTTAQLRDRIVNMVKQDYCEFDVDIATTTTAPSATEARWQIIGIGSDDESVSGSDLFGVAQDVDLNNIVLKDYARVYSKSFLNAYGGAGDALNGANSTLERWATAISHTVTHEAGHNFGLAHGDSTQRTGEDDQNHHIMATGSTGLTGEMRAGRNRHFGDQEYEILGHNIGLRVKTLYNWDFTNPNAESAHSLVLTVLSPASALTVNWFYAGSTSPWTSPTIASDGTQAYQGTTYNKFRLTFSVAKAWSGGTAGVVPGGGEFHVGATFAESDPIIVFETRLRNSAAANLNLHPRLAGFDTTADLSTGDFSIRAFNMDPSDIVQIEDLQISLLPRMGSIESMLTGAQLQSVQGVPIPMRRPSQAFTGLKERQLQTSINVRLARLSDPRSVEVFYNPTNCIPGYRSGGAQDAKTGEMEYCPKGWAISLFPSTYVYVIATIVQQNAKHWDKTQAKYVTGPLRSKVFYQFAGIVPDFNTNGVDDLIDIRTGVSRDKNNNGVVDEVEKDRTAQATRKFQWWWIVAAVVGLGLWLILRRKK